MKGKLTSCICIAVLLLFCKVSTLSAQNTIVLNLQSLQQNMPKLDERSVAIGNQFILIINNQTNFNNLPVELSLSIKGNGIEIKSNDYIQGKTTAIPSFSNKVLYAKDLAPYFDIDNLTFSGFSKEDYINNIPLPQGLYTICFEAKASTSDANYSPKSTCVNLLSQLNDPPIIITPKNSEQVDLSKPYLFSWQPRHFATGLTEYEFEIYEDNGLSINEVINNYNPVYSLKTYSQSTLLNSGSRYLQNNTRYVCVVKVLPGEQYLPFKNGGYSNEVYFQTKEKSSERSSTEVCEYPNGMVFINEIANGEELNNDEFVELVVVGSNVRGSFVNLEGWIIDDNNYNKAEIGNEAGHIRLGSCFNNLPKGTIILIYSDAPGSVHPKINPANDGLHNGVLQVPFSSDCIIKYRACPDHQGDITDYNCSAARDNNEPFWNQYIPMRNSKDVLQVRQPNYSLEHALIWVTNDYEFSGSFRTQHFGQNVGNTFLALTSGSSWFTQSNYSSGSFANATPGEANNSVNANLIAAITNNVGGGSDFSISCSQQNDFNGIKVKITVSGSPGPYEVSYNGNTYTVTTNPIILGPFVLGTYNFTVKDKITKCIDFCDIALVPNCNVGEACNDFDPCTKNDKLDGNCVCKGDPLEDVVITSIPAAEEVCDYCLQAAKPNLPNVFVKSIIKELSFKMPDGTVQTFNASNDGDGIFHFPYCWGGGNVCTGYLNLFNGFTDDMQEWVGNQPTVKGDFTKGSKVCSSTQDGVSLFIEKTNLKDIQLNIDLYYTTPPPNGVEFIVPFNSLAVKIQCYASPAIKLTASVGCGGTTSYLWSDGQQTQSITIANPNACYKVTVTCEYMDLNGNRIRDPNEPAGCSFVGTYGTNCTCIVGAPCPDADPCLFEGVYDANCKCPTPLPMPDSDNDTVCDEEDICPGYDDLLDEDNDNIPDGCDPSIDCNAIAHQVTKTIVDEGKCDYCVDLTKMLVNPASTQQNPLPPFDNINIDALRLTSSINGPITIDKTTAGFNFPYCFSQSTLVDYATFENGWGIWHDGGTNCDLSTIPSQALSVPNALRLRSTSATSYSYTSAVNIKDANEVTLEFYTKSIQNVANDRIAINFSVDGGPYQSMAQFKYSVDYDNNQYKKLKVTYKNTTNKKSIIFRIVNQHTGLPSLFKTNLFDDVKITKTCANISGLASSLNAWLPANGYQGQAVYSNESSLCILATNLKAEYLSNSKDQYAGQQSFQALNCTGAPFGQYGIKYNATAECQDATYAWSNGATTQSITTTNPKLGFVVTITCGNGCKYVHTVGNENCIVGTPCDGGGCYKPNTSFIDENCNCVGELDPINDTNANGICDEDPSECFCNVLNYTDYNNNGICDCLEMDSDNDGICNCKECKAKPTIDYKPSGLTRTYYDYCINLSTFASKKLTSAVISKPGQSITLTNAILVNGSPVFHFPYCEDAAGNACTESKSLKKFASDFYYWASSTGESITAHYKTGTQACTGTKSIEITNFTFSVIKLNFENTPIYTVSPSASVVKPYGFYVKVDFSEPTLCTNPSYVWSDPSVQSGTWPFAETKAIGYKVTVTCGDGCQYVLATQGNTCYVGEACDDGDLCTEGGHFNNKCECISTTTFPDKDGDGVCDPYDVCDGYDDHLDDDSDGIPNGCDGCYSDGEICTYTNTFADFSRCRGPYILSGISVVDKKYGEEYDLNQIPAFFDFPYCLPNPFALNVDCPPNASNAINSLFVQLQNWLDATAYGGTVAGSFTNGQLNISITNTSLVFKNWNISCSIFNGGGTIAGGGTGSRQLYDFTSQCLEGKIGEKCDDKNACTLFDSYDAACNCVGVYMDSDGDLVCDPQDQCNWFPDQIDYDEDGVPDGCDTSGLRCNNEFISFCNYLRKVAGCGSKIMPVNLINYQDTIRTWLTTANWDIPLFNISALQSDLQYNTDYDADGIVNFLDPCPGVHPNSQNASTINANAQNFVNAQGYHDLSSFVNCSCNEPTNIPTQAKVAFLSFVLFSPLNDFLTFNDGSKMSPGCIAGSGLTINYDTWFQTGWLTDVNSGCRIQFKVDCDCNCSYKKLNDYNDDGMCGDTEIIINPPCTNICTSTDPCIVMTQDANCNCVPQPAPDSDGDGVCDPLDQCPGEPDNGDQDGDGVADCKDDCPTLPGGKGDSCDDGDPCTYSDVIRDNCECKGFEVDSDGDKVNDCEDCKIMFTDPATPGSLPVAVDRFGPFISDCYKCYKVDCDVCPNLDDNTDANGIDKDGDGTLDGNGLPDCLEPPYHEIGCPSDIQVIPGKGIVLVFDNTDDKIKESDLPQPIGFISISGNNSMEVSDYLTIGNIREVGSKYEVLYGFSELTGFSDYSYLGVSFASHQNCPLINNNTLTDAKCPNNIEIVDGKLVLTIPTDGENIDVMKLLGSFEVIFTNLSGGSDFNLNANVSPSNINKPISDPDRFNISLGEASNMPDFNTYGGTVSVTLPNGIKCTFNNGNQLPCTGGTLIPGSPCDCDPATLPPGESCECYTHFRIDNNCNCIGDPKPDTDGDGICDEFDPCPGEKTIQATGLCPCPKLILITGGQTSIVNGSDLSIPFDLTDAAKFANLSVSISGGPPGGPPIPNMPLTNPFIISNLPKGYPLTITITGNCATGGNSSFEIPLSPIPFESNPGLCGIVAPTGNLSSLILLPKLVKNDVFKAYDFNVTVREAKGSYGKFTGKGYIKVPYFEKIRLNVTFSNITISEHKQMVAGHINVNGLGIAVLNDPYNDIINDGVNEIINELEDLSDILEEVGGVLETIEEFFETTKEFASDKAKECEIISKELEALKLYAETHPQDPTNKDKIKTKTAGLKACLDEYEEQLKVTLAKYLSFLSDASTYIVNECAANGNYEAPVDAILLNQATNPLTLYNNSINSIITSLQGSGNTSSIQNNHKSELKIPMSNDNIEIAADAYFTAESNRDLCLAFIDLKEILAAASNEDKLSIITEVFKATNKIGQELSALIKDEILANASNQSIYDNHKTEIHKIFKSVLIYNLYNVTKE